MPVPIREGDLTKVAALMNRLASVNAGDVGELDSDEQRLVLDDRRRRLTTALMNAGIEVRPDLPAREAAKEVEPEPVVYATGASDFMPPSDIAELAP